MMTREVYFICGVKWRCFQYIIIVLDYLQMIRYFTKSTCLNFAGFCELNNKMYGISSRIGGQSADGLYQKYAGGFVNQDLQFFKEKVHKSSLAADRKKQILPGVNIITTKEECQKCVEILMKSNTIAAWDTETMDLDVKQQAPIGKGKIICASFFAGPEFNFGRGPRVFIDNFGKNAGLLNYFKPYLQSQKHLKVWHNYGFDRHLFYNHGIDVKGFGGDTMHMARLLDPSKMFGQYSLSSLTKEFSKNILKLSNKKIELILNDLTIKIASETNPEKQKFLYQQSNNLQAYLDVYCKSFKVQKKKMQLLFGRKKMLKQGGQGVSYEYPNTLTLHTNKQYIQRWIEYCVLDSESTFFLRQCLQQNLKERKISHKNNQAYNPKLPRTMWEIYETYWRPFGQILTNMERQGIRVDREYMEKIKDDAVYDLQKKKQYFLNFLTTFQEDKNIDHFNPSSPLQLQQLLYAPCQLKLEQAKRLKEVEKKKEEQKMSKEDRELLQAIEWSQKNANQAYEDETTKKIVRKAVTLNELYKTFKIQNKYGSKPKFVQMKVKGLQIPFQTSTPTGLPSVQEAVLEQLAGDPQNQKYGKAYQFFAKKGNPQFGKQLCLALKVLVNYSSIQTLLKTFIEPLISYIDHTSRIHCSLNINTQTGRLSARKPNLQNQPALDKDIYKIRKAFTAQKGKKFVVADYGQLQLRVLAHLTNCQAMITAFKEGGDFHSRTAIGMFSYIKKQIDEGTILLEWDKSKGKPPVPLLKDKYAAQRKKAKTVNFSIAYGKTAQGFANDWNCSLQQAKKVIEAWFDSRKQVRQWQKNKKYIAKTKHITQTLLGRQRLLKKFYQSQRNKSLAGMGDRRAINTPIQGGAADIVIASMVKISRNQRLKELGWKLLMQIHDQLILQGPQQSAEQALALVKYDMSHPFDFDLRVQLQVDAKIGNNWYECK